jgi:hypothetical protein
MGLPRIVHAIGGGDIGVAERTRVGRGKNALQALDLRNDVFDVHSQPV